MNSAPSAGLRPRPWTWMTPGSLAVTGADGRSSASPHPRRSSVVVTAATARGFMVEQRRSILHSSIEPATLSGMDDRVAVITDIHANLPALEAALARIEELGI